MSSILYPVGHSTRSLSELIELLKRHGVAAVAAVRRFPKSRKYPHFNNDSLAQSLPSEGLRYTPAPALGGRRQAVANSGNTGWRNEGFRGYADYMQTPDFLRGLDLLAALASETRTAMMCAEAVPWRCHRSLIADAMLVRGWHVLDILGRSTPAAHHLTKFASVDGARITYPAPGDAGAAAPGLFDDISLDDSVPRQ